MGRDPSVDDLRLAQLTEVTGLSPELIRAWERRYGFPTPTRTGGGHRRYSRDQAEALHRAALLIRSGFRAREAIARAQQTPQEAPSNEVLDQSAAALAESLIAGNPAHALSLLRSTEHALGFEAALEERVLPGLRRVGSGWRTGSLSVAQEHTATGIVISWLGTVRAGLRPVGGPIKVLIATPAGEHHAVPVWCLELLLSRRGVRALALGSDVPLEALERDLDARRPRALVFSISRPEALGALRAGAAAAAARGIRVFAGGPGLNGGVPAVQPLPGTLSEAANLLAAL